MLLLVSSAFSLASLLANLACALHVLQNMSCSSAAPQRHVGQRSNVGLKGLLKGLTDPRSISRIWMKIWWVCIELRGAEYGGLVGCECRCVYGPRFCERTAGYP